MTQKYNTSFTCEYFCQHILHIRRQGLLLTLKCVPFSHLVWHAYRPWSQIFYFVKLLSEISLTAQNYGTLLCLVKSLNKGCTVSCNEQDLARTAMWGRTGQVKLRTFTQYPNAQTTVAVIARKVCIPFPLNASWTVTDDWRIQRRQWTKWWGNIMLWWQKFRMWYVL